MIVGHKNYLAFLLGFSEKYEENDLNFIENQCNSKFNQFKYEKQKINSKSMTFYICIPLLLLIGLNILMNGKPIRSTYFLIAGICIDFLVFLFITKYENSYTRLKCFRYIRFFLFYFNITMNWIFPVNPVFEQTLRYTYCGGFYLNFLQNYFLDFNNYLPIIIMILNSTILLLQQYLRELGYFYFIPEIIFNIVYYITFSLLKNSELRSEKESFLESYKNNNYIDYIQNLVNVLNTMIISVQNQEILFVNDFTYNYFTNNPQLKNPTIVYINSEESLYNKNHNDYGNEQIPTNSNINNQVKNFLDLLLLYSSLNENYLKGEKFNEIINSFSSEHKLDSIKFIKLGYFNHSEYKDLYYEIHARKLKYHNEAIELLIYDISEIKNAEKKAIESKFKHKILAKVAHEFKTPLITIISLSERIVKDQESNLLDKETKKNLYYINNLSNYTLSLISDIIHYVSDYVNLRINKNEVDLHEVMDFCNNVLKTLVECNEHKSNKIQTKLIIDYKLDNLKLFTDENRLKQILLNFISNAFKFTQQGIIKLKAKYINENNLIEISVKDTGVGIKEEDHDLIFKENVQINVDNEYNTHGSGLGLSIVKNMAENLNYKIGFKSTYGKGSKFYIIINCNKSGNQSKFRTVSLTDINNLSEKLKGKDLNNRKINKKIKNINLKNTISDYSDHSESIILIENKFDENDSNKTRKIKFTGFNLDKVLLIKNLEITGFSFTINNPLIKTNNKIKLVVVDDHKFIRENTVNLLKNLLKNFNSSLYEIVECSDGIELLNIVRLDTGNQIKLILTDENMEYLNGSESVRIIRKLQENRKIKQYQIVSITAFDDEESKKRILESGVNSIINKPCNKSDLSKLIDNFLIPFINN